MKLPANVKKHLPYLLGIIVVVAILWAVYKAAQVTQGGGGYVQPEDGDFGEHFNASNLSIEVHAAFDGFSTSYELQSILRTLLDLTDDELVAVSNAYAANYSHTDHPTLRAKIGAEWWMWNPITINLRNTLANRLMMLGL